MNGYKTIKTIILSCLLLSNVQAVSQYDITDLGTLGGNNSFAHGINDLGQIVGYANDNSGAEIAYIWQNGVMSSIANWQTFGINRSNASKINNNGYAVGTYYSAGSVVRPYAALNGDLLLPFTGEGYAYDINIHNKIIAKVNGQTQLKDLNTNEVTSLGSLTTASAINDNNQIVGSSVMYEDGAFTPLGDLGFANTWAKDINNSSEVVGYSYTEARKQHAFIWNEIDGMTDLGTLGGSTSSANALNEFSQIVGFSSNVSGSFRATIWGQTVATDLTGLVVDLTGWAHLSEARDINNLGQIVGFGVTDSGDKHAFLLTPATVHFADGDLAPFGNPDGIINTADYLIALRIVTGGLVVTPLELSHGDLYPPDSPDGIIDLRDVLLILKLL